MKISNSKKQLAKIIHENGGWREGAEFTAQDGDGTGSIDFFKSKPRLYRGDIFWKGDYDCDDRIERTGVTIKNWHQTILSRDEYFHLYPAPDADGWIEWKGGECPVEKGTLVDVRFKNGMEMVGAPAGQTPDHFPRNVTAWARSSAPGAIIAYRLHKPEVKPEFCESVMRSIPEPESKPTIEQLAADYRNLKDFADRKQEEAKAAKADAKAKLAELVAAGEALGLVLSVTDAESKPELAIINWRNLRVADVIWYGGDDELSPGEYHVMEIEAPDYEGYRTVLVNGVNGGHWIDTRAGWGFIRRPTKGGADA